MRRFSVLSVVLVGFALAGPSGAPRPPSVVTLPLTEVVLYSSGVAYVQREGQVEGDARIDLSIPARDVDDLLRSLVASDRSGRPVRAVTYERGEFPARVLRSFRLDLAAQRQVSLHCRGHGKRSLKVGHVVEGPVWKASYRLLLGKDRGNLQGWALVDNTTDEDWREVRVGLVSSRPFSFATGLDQPLFVPRPKVALETLASPRPSLTGHLPALLEALVEEADWADVAELRLGEALERLAARYGLRFTWNNRAFQWSNKEGKYDVAWQKLEDYKAERGKVRTVGALLGRMLAAVPSVSPAVGVLWPSHIEITTAEVADEKAVSFEFWPGARLYVAGLGRYQVTPPRAVSERPRWSWDEWKEARAAGRLAAPFPAADVEAARELPEGGGPAHVFLDEKVTLPAQRSALLPLVRQGVPARPVSVFDEKAHPQHPFLSVVLTNQAGMALASGPVSVFAGTNYLGDALLPSLQPGEQRLVTFAVDVAVEVRTARAQRAPPEVGRLTIDRGRVLGETTVRETRMLLIRNRSPRWRDLLVAHPAREGWRLTGAETPAEQTAEGHRFRWALKAGEVLRKEIVEERARAWSLDVRAASDAQLRELAAIGGAIREALSGVLARRAAIGFAVREVKELASQARSVRQEQARLRDRLATLPVDSDARRELLDRFEALEDALDRLRTALRQKRAEEQALRQDLEKFTASASAP